MLCVLKDVQSNSGAVQKMVRLKIPPARRDREQDIEKEGDENGFLDEQNYIQALGADMEGERNILLVHLFYCHQILITAPRLPLKKKKKKKSFVWLEKCHFPPCYN